MDSNSTTTDSDSTDPITDSNPTTTDGNPIVTVYTREGCHLCEEAIDTIRRVADSSRTGIFLDVIDVDTDPELRAEYDERVPYVLVDGRPQFKYRVDEAELEALLEGTDDEPN
jgi:glutaredoxin